MEELTCKGCGKPFRKSWGGVQLFCSIQCRERNRNRVLERPFIALDGEGIQNRYVLLAASTGATLEGKSLQTEECLNFLLDLPSSKNGHTRPIYVWFAMDYDVNMILGDIPLGTRGQNNSYGTIQQLRDENRCDWGDYRITYFKRKIFRVSRFNRTFTSYDLWSFFGSSFENALREWGIKVPDIISEGKAARGSFDSWSSEKLKRYNNAELELLVQLADKLRESTLPLDLSVRSWHGPGSLAGAWLGKNKVHRYMKGEIPTALKDVATRAYFGGRIDATGYGISNPVHHYDIVSAYPSAIADLPNLTKLHWKHLGRIKDPLTVFELSPIFVARIRWKIPRQSWGILPWRNKQGTIRYPLEGEGWYWHHEILALLGGVNAGDFTIQEIWFAEGFNEQPLHNLIHETFHYRKELKEQKNPAHFSTKLILNSLYGKFAQTVGKARYYNPIMAGLITSHARAKLLQVIDEHTLCVMTDSIWSSAPIKAELSSELGGWEQQEETRLVLAEAGLYSASAPGQEPWIWQRGFDRNTPVDIEGIVNEWLGTGFDFQPQYKVHRFVGMGLASMTKLPWRNWVDINRVIHPVPLTGTTKRLPTYPLLEDEEPQEESGFVKLRLRPRDELALSYPYMKETLEDELVIRQLEDETEEI